MIVVEHHPLLGWVEKVESPNLEAELLGLIQRKHFAEEEVSINLLGHAAVLEDGPPLGRMTHRPRTRTVVVKEGHPY